MVTTKDITAEIESFLQALMAEGYKINKAILFGSMAKGTPHEYSDIDLAVWSDEFDENYFTTVEKTAHMKLSHKKIELHPFRSTDTSETNPFIEEIENSGKLVFPE